MESAECGDSDAADIVTGCNLMNIQNFRLICIVEGLPHDELLDVKYKRVRGLTKKKRAFDHTRRLQLCLQFATR